MIKKFFITLILTGIFIYPVVGQTSAQATMRVSVKVVKSLSVETISPGKVNFLSTSAVDLGSLILTGITSENSFITNSAITLSNREGNKVKFEINSTIEESESSISIVEFSGILPEAIKADDYEGRLSTTIEYF